MKEKIVIWENGLIPMPIDRIGDFFNGSCPDPCDMIKGPCVCGAWHHLRDWPTELLERIKR